MYWVVVFYLMFGYGIALGVFSKSEKSLDVDIDGPFVTAVLSWPVVIGIWVGQKIK